MQCDVSRLRAGCSIVAIPGLPAARVHVVRAPSSAAGFRYRGLWHRAYAGGLESALVFGSAAARSGVEFGPTLCSTTAVPTCLTGRFRAVFALVALVSGVLTEATYGGLEHVQRMENSSDRGYFV